MWRTAIGLIKRILGLGLAAIGLSGLQAFGGELKIEVSDKDRAPLPCRVHLADSEGKSIRAPGLPFWRDHFVCAGRVSLTLPAGHYTYAIERGPEYGTSVGRVEVGEDATAVLRTQLVRLTNLREAGWQSGDLHVHRKPEEIELLMRAEDLDVAPVITWWNKRSLWQDRDVPSRTLTRFGLGRMYDIMAGEDEREGGAILYFGLTKPLEIRDAQREIPSSLEYVRQARTAQPDCWLDIEKPFWWDVPMWLASGELNSIGLANNHMCRSSMYESEAWGKPRDAERLPAPRGNGFWTQEVYYHILNCGLRIPPSAGSASGVLPNPVGYNRVYVQVGKQAGQVDPPTRWRRWWEGLRAGRSFVTNGPLLLCRANDAHPGKEFQAADRVEIEFQVRLAGRDRVEQLELIHNGETVQRIPCGSSSGEFVFRHEFTASGWFLVRAIADVKHTFRFASTAPWYVSLEQHPFVVQRESAEFFKQWTDERINRVRKNVTDPDSLRRVLEDHEEARLFWADRVNQSR